MYNISQKSLLQKGKMMHNIGFYCSWFYNCIIIWAMKFFIMMNGKKNHWHSHGSKTGIPSWQTHKEGNVMRAPHWGLGLSPRLRNVWSQIVALKTLIIALKTLIVINFIVEWPTVELQLRLWIPSTITPTDCPVLHPSREIFTFRAIAAKKTSIHKAISYKLQKKELMGFNCNYIKDEIVFSTYPATTMKRSSRFHVSAR